VALVWTIAGALLGGHFQPLNGLFVLGVLGLTCAALAGIGLLSAAFVVVFKQSEPFTGGFLALSMLLSGMMYPTSVLPSWLGVLAPFLPLTHAAALTRMLFISGADTSALAGHLLALSAFGLLLPAGVVALRWSFKLARQTGSLGQY
jgi:ABC-2 type transport system permease protein